jgi:hypothetical protein
MPQTFIIAWFDTEDSADGAVRRLETEGIPSNTVRRYGKVKGAPGHEPGEQSAGGFWDWVLGEESPVRDSSIYRRSMEAGSTVVAVPVTGEAVARVTDILRRCNPTGLEERQQPGG